MELFDSSHLVNLQILLLSGAEGPWCKCNWFSDPSGLMLTKTATSPLGVASKATVTGFFGSYCLNTWSDIISRMFLYNNLTNSTSDHPLRGYTMEQNRITDFPRSLRSLKNAFCSAMQRFLALEHLKLPTHFLWFCAVLKSIPCPQKSISSFRNSFFCTFALLPCRFKRLTTCLRLFRCSSVSIPVHNAIF